MLCCTLLMIASRFFVLPGAGGVSRSHYIHHKLWQYVESLIRRIMFGQEKYSTAKTRVVGSIESLILISDWHPRAIHFPPDTDGWDSELILHDFETRGHRRRQTSNETPLVRWREDVFEPAKRSERMSWMLLGAATTLGCELGIFSNDGGSTEGRLSAMEAEIPRMDRARKLLQIYVTQMSVKLGCPSILPTNLDFQTNFASASRPPIADAGWIALTNSWMELTRLTKTALAIFFQSATQTKQHLLSGHYITLLQHFSSSLRSWHDVLEGGTTGKPRHSKTH